MKIANGIFAAFAALGLSFLAPAAHAAPIADGEALPAAAGARPVAGEGRLLGAAPHVPLATLSQRGRAHEVVLKSPPSGACVTWARRGERFRTIDAYGRIVGSAEVVAGVGRRATQCYELATRPLRGKPGVGLLVSESGPWHGARSVRWFPGAAEKHALADGLTHGAPRLHAALAHALYFKMPEKAGGARFAVVAGRELAIARLDKKGWNLVETVPVELKSKKGRGHGVRPVAVLDLDGDGVPEIVVREHVGSRTRERILRFDGKRFVPAATGAGG